MNHMQTTRTVLSAVSLNACRLVDTSYRKKSLKEVWQKEEPMTGGDSRNTQRKTAENQIKVDVIRVSLVCS